MAWLAPKTAADGVISSLGGISWRMTKTGAGLAAGDAGKYITIWGAPTSDNDGHFLITNADTDYVDFDNAAGFAETINSWEVVDSSVPNDWLLTEISGINQSSAKMLHSDPPLNSNQLTDPFYSLYTRRFWSYNVSSHLWMLKEDRNPDFIDDSSPQAISMVMRRETATFYPKGFMLFLRKGANPQYGYWVSVSLGNNDAKIFIGNRNATTWAPYDPSHGGAGPAAYANIAIPTGDWCAMRLVVNTEASDVRVRAYYIGNSTTLNSLDVNGEPSWGSPVIEAKHINGTPTPTVLAGISGPSNWISASPILSGSPAWSWGVIGNGDGASYTVADAIRVKRVLL